MDSMPDKPSFRPSEMDAEFAAMRGDAASAQGHSETKMSGQRGRNIGVGVAVGVVIGVVLGLVFGNFIVGNRHRHRARRGNRGGDGSVGA